MKKQKLNEYIQFEDLDTMNTSTKSKTINKHSLRSKNKMRVSFVKETKSLHKKKQLIMLKKYIERAPTLFYHQLI